MTFSWPLRSRKFALLVWLGALLFCAWALADIVLRLITPQTVATSWQRHTDPHQAARDINLAAPLAAQTSGDSVVADDTASNASYTLVGVATGFGDYPGFALLKPAGGSVQAVPLGAEVSPGVRLSALSAQAAELERNGQHEKIPLQKSQHADAISASPPPLAPAASPQSP